jgi:predicted nucleotidyltransferase
MRIQKVTSIVQKYLRKVEKAGIPVTQAYIFGSQIKGKARYGSDIDLCIISPRFGRDRQKERIMLMNLRDDTTDTIEPHPYSPSDFDNHFDSLSLEIKKTGLTI